MDAYPTGHHTIRKETKMNENQQIKARENKLRRMAARQDLVLVKSRRRDPNALGFGTYMLTDLSNNVVHADPALGQGYGLDLDDVENYLKRS